jgi:hypothetical protein
MAFMQRHFRSLRRPWWFWRAMSNRRDRLEEEAGGGAPEWVPEGATSAGQFDGQQYYLDGEIVEEIAFFVADEEFSYFLDYNPTNHTEDGIGTSTASYVVQINPAFLSGVADALTIVLDVSLADAATSDFMGFDIFSADQSLWMYGTIGTGAARLHDGIDSYSEDVALASGRHRVAYTITSGRIAMSRNGGAVVEFEGTNAYENQFERIGVSVNEEANRGNLILSISAHPPVANAGLPALSALE